MNKKPSTIYRVISALFGLIYSAIPLGIITVVMAFVLGIFCGLIATVYRYAFNMFGG